MNIYFQQQKDNKGGLEGEIQKLVFLIMKKVHKLIEGGQIKLFDENVSSMDGRPQFSKEENMKEAMRRFIATDD